MFSLGAFTAFILSLALVAIADPAITLPDPGHIYNEGGTCQIGWNPDSTGQWKTMNIQLMTGSNGQMVPLTSSSSYVFFGQMMIDPCLLSYPPAVATVDGTTSPGTFSYTCPAVRVALYCPRAYFDLFNSMSCFFFRSPSMQPFTSTNSPALATPLIFSGPAALPSRTRAVQP
jgi:hypothetical protein